jgi:hypothetical protein
MKMEKKLKIDIDGLIDLEFDSLVETRNKFDCPIKELKNGT